jgi:hypothetical protein
MGAGSTRELIPQTRRERQTNYGSTESVVGPGLQSLFHMDKAQASGLVLYVECRDFFVPPDAVGTADFRPFVHVTWGHGASSVKGDFDCTFRQRIPLVGSDVDVQAYIASLAYPGQAPGVDVPITATSKFRAFVAEGTDGIELFPTVWQTQLNASSGTFGQVNAINLESGAATPGQTRLASLRAINPGDFAYLLLFDASAVPATGAVPVDACPLPPATTDNQGPIALELGQTRAFVNGLAWAVSSTLFTYTPIENPIFLSVEIES